jgi:hypothetical protein
MEFRDETCASRVIQRFWRGLLACATSKEFFKELTEKRRDYLAAVLQSVYVNGCIDDCEYTLLPVCTTHTVFFMRMCY